jgi:O-antigen/teichoic acid export membrane protein
MLPKNLVPFNLAKPNPLANPTGTLSEDLSQNEPEQGSSNGSSNGARRMAETVPNNLPDQNLPDQNLPDQKPSDIPTGRPAQTETRNSAGLGRQIAKRATGSFGLKLGMMAFSFGTNILLTRTLGVKDFGLYSYIITWISLLQIPSDFGLTSVVTRMVAVYQVKGQWRLMRGLLSWSNLVVATTAISLGLLAATAAWFLRPQLPPNSLHLVWLGLLAVPFYALTSLRQGTMRGLQKVILGQLPEFIIQPLLFIIAFASSMVLLGERLNLTWVMGLRFLSVMLAYNIGAAMLQKELPKQIKQDLPKYEVDVWVKSALPFVLAALMMILNNKASILMLGAVKGAEEVALYVVASRGADLLIFALGVVNLSTGPNFARLHAQGNLPKLQQLVTQSARAIFFLTLPLALGLIAFGHWFLLLFGPEFTQSYPVLVTLSIGQIINAFTGSVALLLSMTGHERDTLIGRSIGAALNIIFNACLVPHWGAEGAAISTAISTAIWNIILLFAVYKRLGINATAFSFPAFPSSRKF